MSRRASGLQAWILQRVTAIYLALYILFLCFHFGFSGPIDYVTWKEWVGSPVISTSGGLFFLAMLIHAWVGIRDILIDYIHPIFLRITSLTLVATALVACAVWVMRILL